LNAYERLREKPANPSSEPFLAAKRLIPKGWRSIEPGAYVDLHGITGRVERVDQQHVKYFMDLSPGKKRRVEYSVTYKRRKVGPELNTEKRREPL